MNLESSVSVLWADDKDKRFVVTIAGVDNLTQESRGDVTVLYPQDNGGIFQILYLGGSVLRLREGLPDVAKHDVKIEATKSGRQMKLVVVLEKKVRAYWSPIFKDLRRTAPDS